MWENLNAGIEEFLMIDKVFEILANSIHAYLEHLPELGVTTEKAIAATHIVRDNGTIAINPDSLGLSLINIEEERIVKSQKHVMVAADGTISHVNPEIKLNLFTLIAANFSNYSEGLKYLSGVIQFFQGTNVFTWENTPDLDPRIQKLIVELHSLTFEQQNNLWGSLGAKYLPSVIYKVRLIAIQEAQKTDEQQPILIIETAERGI